MKVKHIHTIPAHKEKEQRIRLSSILVKLFVILPFSFLISSCVKVDVFNTLHPDKGAVILITNWSERGTEVPEPSGYTVLAAGKSFNLTTPTFDLSVFDPVEQILSIHNQISEGISMNGTTATIDKLADGTLYLQPDWLLTYSGSFTPVADDTIHVTATAIQQIRQLTLVLQPEGITSDRITAIEGYMTGVARQLSLGNNTHNEPSNVKLNFTKITGGDDTGKWTATIRLLGIAGNEQKLTGSLLLSDSAEPVPLESILSTDLSDFNNDKKTPLTLKCDITVDSDPATEVGFTATIKSWTKVTSSTGQAN